MNEERPFSVFVAAFLAKTVPSETGCLEWGGRLTPNGYGQVTRRGKTILTHRLAWELSNGEIPDGLFVCHHCDNKRCVNTEHLFLGTPSDNTRDMFSKGRGVNNAGESHGMGRLTTRGVDWIRGAISRGYTQAEIAKSLGVAQTTVSKIKLGQRWAHHV